MTLGIPALKILSWSYLVAGLCIIASSVFQALGNGVYSLLVSFGRQLVVLLPAAKLGGLHVVWWSFPIAEIASLGLSTLFMLRINKKILRPMEQ